MTVKLASIILTLLIVELRGNNFTLLINKMLVDVILILLLKNIMQIVELIKIGILVNY